MDAVKDVYCQYLSRKSLIPMGAKLYTPRPKSVLHCKALIRFLKWSEPGKRGLSTPSFATFMHCAARTHKFIL